MSRSYICTYNLLPEDVENWESILENFHVLGKARYTCGQLEKGEETGHPHIQFYQNFKNPQKLGHYKLLNKGIHAEKCKSEKASMEYCMKKETRIEGPKEYGEKPIHRNCKADWDEVWNKAKEGKIEEIPSTIRTIHYKTLKQIAKDYIEFKDKTHLRGIWIYGEAGAGKSRWVREQANLLKKRLYPKLCNKWWDGYQGEELVCMDDLMPEHKVLCQQLKIWSDRYDCILEVKGAACHSNYEWFIVTSQYAPEEIFTDEKDLAAIQRRFQIYKIKDILDLNLNIIALNNLYNINNQKK